MAEDNLSFSVLVYYIGFSLTTSASPSITVTRILPHSPQVCMPY